MAEAAGTTGAQAAGTRTKVDVRDVVKRFRWEKKGKEHDLLALDGVNLELAEGEFVSVIGPSGCGKTTLLRIVAGLIPFDSGEVRIDGEPIEGPGRERAMVFQSFGLFPWKNVLENVKMPLVVRKMDQEQADGLARQFIGKVGLSGFEDAMPHQLSGGMQQRVGLARALVTDPEILLMDEPFGAIDAQTRELMQEELLRLWSDSGKTVMFVTHDLDEAVTLADRVVVLTRGPGRIRTALEVDLPRPRWSYDVRAEPNFTKVRHEIWQMLKEDLEHQQGEARS